MSVERLGPSTIAFPLEKGKVGYKALHASGFDPQSSSTPCSGADVFDRVSMFLETLYRDMQKGLCGQNVLLISHGLFCRLFLTRFYHWSVSDSPHPDTPLSLSPCPDTLYGSFSLQVEYFHKLWNFDNTQFAIMELNSEGYYQLISPLKSDP